MKLRSNPLFFREGKKRPTACQRHYAKTLTTLLVSIFFAADAPLSGSVHYAYTLFQNTNSAKYRFNPHFYINCITPAMIAAIMGKPTIVNTHLRIITFPGM